ncbi:TPA: TIGR04255 family protein [Legionella pneumophila]|nr:TIGR04255 family protein [Legionella pneumophila]
MKNNLLNLKDNNRKTFKNNFLNAVHSEIGLFGSSIHIIREKQDDIKQSLLAAGFETCRELFHKEVHLNNTPKPKVTFQDDEFLGLIFSSQKPRRELQVLGTKIVYSDYSYKGFEKFSESLSSLCNLINTLLTSKIIKVGLRKVNSIIIDPVSSYEEAFSIFNPVIFGEVRSGLLKDNTLALNQSVTVLEKDKQSCIIRSQIQKKNESMYEATLDLDFIYLNETDWKGVFKNLESMNKWHYDLFIWAVSDELISLMDS